MEETVCARGMELPRLLPRDVPSSQHPDVFTNRKASEPLRSGIYGGFAMKLPYIKLLAIGD